MESTSRLQQRTGPDGAADHGDAPAGAPPSLVREIADMWGEFLGGREVGPEDDFFAVGGNSLTGIKIIDRVARDHGVRLSVRDFYLAGTPAGVAGLVEQGRART